MVHERICRFLRGGNGMQFDHSMDGDPFASLGLHDSEVVARKLGSASAEAAHENGPREDGLCVAIGKLPSGGQQKAVVAGRLAHVSPIVNEAGCIGCNVFDPEEFHPLFAGWQGADNFQRLGFICL